MYLQHTLPNNPQLFPRMFSRDIGSGSGGDGSKKGGKGKGKAAHPVHSATSWLKNTTLDTNNKDENPKQSNPSGEPVAAPSPPVVLPPRAPIPEIEFPAGCIKFDLVSAAYGRNQARRALHLAAKERPDAWITDLAKPIIRDAANRRGVFTKSPREEGRDNEIYRWKDEDLDALKLGLIADAPDVD